MKLTVLERLTLANLLPKEGSFMNLKLLRVARENLSFDENEHNLLNFHQEGDQIMWDESHVIEKETGKRVEGDRPYLEKLMKDNPAGFERVPVIGEKDIEIGEVVTQMVVKELQRLNDKEKLTTEHMSLYEKFVIGND